MPRTGNRVTRWLGRSILRTIGWRLVGDVPDEPKLIVIGAPHTSNWDLILAMSSMLALGLRFSWMMKKEAFFWPLGSLWKRLGGIPIDRSSRNSIGEQMAEAFQQADKLWLGITPEGTRKTVENFRKGYLRIAYSAKVPILLIGIDAIRKRAVIDKVWHLTGDIEIDNKAIKSYFDKHYTGIRSG